MSRRALLPAVLLLGLPLLVACGDDEPANEPNPDTRTGSPSDGGDGGDGPDEPDAAAADPQVAELLTGLDVPWGLAPLDDGSLLVGTRDRAEILLVPPGGGRPEVVGSLEGVRAEGESGLLGLALTADESTLYAYSTGESENTVARMTWDGAALGEPEVVVDGIPGGASYHQGGGLAVGPDDLLYVATGDNGVPEDSQDRDSLSGKVLRYTLDGEPAPGNPFDSPVLSYGHRNVEGLVFDDAGRLWAAEFGQDAFDELNLVEAGQNYGWPEVEGTGGGEEYVDPQAVWSTADASPSGIGWWDGSLWLAGLRGETLWEVPVSQDGAGEPVPHLGGRYGRIRNAAATADGSALLVVTSNTDGRGEPAADDDRLLALTR